MHIRATRLRSIAHAVTVCAVLALATDLEGSHIHMDDECLRCLMVEVDGTSEPLSPSDRTLVLGSRLACAPTSAAREAPGHTNQPRAPPTLP